MGSIELQETHKCVWPNEIIDGISYRGILCIPDNLRYAVFLSVCETFLGERKTPKLTRITTRSLLMVLVTLFYVDLVLLNCL